MSFIQTPGVYHFLSVLLLSVWLGAEKTPAQSLGEALDNTNLVWTTSGSTEWFGHTQVSFTHDSMDAAASGTISHSQASLLETTVTGPAQVGFWWKVSSEYNYDLFIFYVDATEQARISGEIAWEHKRFPVPAGDHTLRWLYSKDNRVQTGLDRAFLDEVIFTSTPMIAAQPQSQSVLVGMDMQFSVLVVGIEPLAYQWFLQDSTPVAGATNASLLWTNLQPEHAGNYYVVITNAYGAITSSVANLGVYSFAELLDNTNLLWSTSGDAPWRLGTNITHDGSDAAESGVLTAAFPQSSILEARAATAGVLTFWWKVLGREFDALAFQTGDQEQGRISGTVDWEQRSFSVPMNQLLRWTFSKWWNASGSERGWLDQVTFTPVYAPLIFAQPQDRTIPAGANVQVSVGVIGAEPLAFQWYYQGTNTLLYEANVLTLSNVQPSQAGGYSVVVSNAYGMVTSQVAVLTVYSLGDALDNTSLQWRTNGNAGWFSQTEVTHDGVDAVASGLLTHNEFSILDTTITGPGTLTFWWKVSSEVGFDFLGLYIGFWEEGIPEVARISGEVDWRQYSVVLPAGPQLVRWVYSKDATESHGLDRAWLDEVMFMPPTSPLIVSQPQSQTASVNTLASFSVTAFGPEPLAFQWYFNESAALADATNAMLELGPIQLSQAGSYHVVVSNIYGVVTSAVARLSMISLAEAVDNSNLVWTTYPTNRPGSTPPDYLWYVDTGTAHDGRDAATAGSIFSEGTVLATTVVGPGTVGFWWKVSSHDCCEFLMFYIGTDVQAQIKGEADWEYRTFAVPEGTHVLSWEYADYVEGISWNGDRAWVDEVAYVPGDGSPKMATQPRNRTILAGTDVTFPAAALGAPPLSFQWFFNQSTALPDATNACLRLSTVQPAQGGAYHLVVSNVSGMVTSQVATLRVIQMVLKSEFDSNVESWDVKVVNDVAYLADGVDGLQVFDVSNETNIVRLGGYDTSGEARAVQVVWPLVYVADGPAGLQIFDVRNPTNVTRVGGLEIKGYAYNLQLIGHLAFVADGSAGLQTLDVSNPTNIVRVGNFQTFGEAFAVRVINDLAYVAVYGGLQILDVRDPANMMPIGSHPGGSIQDVDVIGSKAYLAEADFSDEHASLEILEVGDPTHPSRLNRAVNFSIGGDFAHLHVVGDLAFLGTHSSRLSLVDIGDPTDIDWFGFYDTAGAVNGMQVNGNTLYLANGPLGLKIIELGATPPFPPALASAGISNGLFQASLKGLQIPGTLIIESSADLVQWQPILTNSIASRNFLFAYPAGADGSARFFRAMVR